MSYEAREIQTFSNISATTSPFTLHGGKYGLTAKATWNSGSLTLQRLSADGTNYAACMTGFVADNYAALDLPVGTYRIAIVDATGVYVDLTSIQIPLA